MTTFARELDDLPHVRGAPFDQAARRPQPRTIDERARQMEAIVGAGQQLQEHLELALCILEGGDVDEHEAEDEPSDRLDLAQAAGTRASRDVAQDRRRFGDLLQAIEAATLRERELERDRRRNLREERRAFQGTIRGRA